MIPRIQFALKGWQSQITLKKIQQAIVGGYLQNTTTSIISFKGVLQPLKPQALMLKPLETRAWKWYTIHTSENVSLAINDLVDYGGKEFKVMEKIDYSLNGFFEFHLVENYDSN